MNIYRCLILLCFFNIVDMVWGDERQKDQDHFWTESIRINNLTNDRITILPFKFFSDGMSLEGELNPFFAAGKTAIYLKPLKIYDEITVQWISKNILKSSVVSVAYPKILQEENIELIFITINFDNDKCFISFDIATENDDFFSILPDGTIIDLEKIKSRNRCLLFSHEYSFLNSVVDPHFIAGFFNVPFYNQYINVELDINCKLLYVSTRDEMIMVQDIINQKNACQSLLLICHCLQKGLLNLTINGNCFISLNRVSQGNLLKIR